MQLGMRDASDNLVAVSQDPSLALGVAGQTERKSTLNLWPRDLRAVRIPKDPFIQTLPLTRFPESKILLLPFRR